MALYGIIRIRGIPDTPPKVRYILSLLRLHKKFHATVYPSSLPGIDGMLIEAQHWITWGELEYDTLYRLILYRGRAPGNKRVTDEYIAKLTPYKSVKELVDALFAEKIYLHKLSNIVKPVFRLHPPRGGFKGSIKKHYRDGGELGYRGKDINKLILRMI